MYSVNLLIFCLDHMAVRYFFCELYILNVYICVDAFILIHFCFYILIIIYSLTIVIGFFVCVHVCVLSMYAPSNVWHMHVKWFFKILLFVYVYVHTHVHICASVQGAEEDVKFGCSLVPLDNF